MAYELEGINPSHSFGDYIVFNVFQWPPMIDYCRTVAPAIMDQVDDWLVNEGQGLDHADAAQLGRLLMVSLLDGRFEQAAAEFDPEEYRARPELLGNAMLNTEFARITGMQPAGEFELNRDHLLLLSLFLGVCGGFRVR